jgi:hypothetical protein
VRVEAEITDQDKQQLRSALQAPDPDWREALQLLLQAHTSDLLGMQRLRAFLLQHLATAGERFHPRLEAMVQAVEQQVCQAAQDGAALERVAADLLDLQAQRAQLQQQIELHRDLIELAVGHGNKRGLGTHRVSVGQPGVSLRVLDAEQVPAAFLRPQPDRKAILEQFRSTGEIIPGTQVNPRRPTVGVRVDGAAGGGGSGHTPPATSESP